MLLYYEHHTDSDCFNRCENPTLSLKEIVESQYGRIECFDVSHHFVKRLQQSMYDVAGAVMFIKNKDELKFFLQCKKLLEDLYLLIVLARDDSAMAGNALALRPRYLACWEKDKKEIVRVLHNFIQMTKKRTRIMLPGDNSMDYKISQLQHGILHVSDLDHDNSDQINGKGGGS